MERIWLRSYPDGVPEEIDVGRYSSLVHLLEDSFARFRDRKAIICNDTAVTYGDLDEMSAALGGYLQKMGLRRGARVALMLPNVPHNAVSSAAILRAGYVVVNVNPLYTPRELEHQLKDSGAEAIILRDGSIGTLDKIVANTRIAHVIIDRSNRQSMDGYARMSHASPMLNIISFPEALEVGRKRGLSRRAIGGDDIAFLQYTGGTTGLSKGAVLSQRNLLANVLQANAWFQPALAIPPVVDQLTIVCALPLYHIFALTICYLWGVHIGGVNVLIENPRDTDAVIKELQRHRPHWFPGVNTLYNAILHHPSVQDVDFSQLKISLGAGMAVQRSVAESWRKLTGCEISEAYGLSETSPGLTCNPLTVAQFTGTIGLPLPSTDLSIRNDEGQEVAVGQAGEICARGPQVMTGYWGQAEETEKVMTDDGYFRTGDIGVMASDGFVKIVDRKKDVIVVSGFKVYPNEVEEVIASHPGVLECAAVGVSDDHHRETVKVFVVQKDLGTTAQDIIQFAAARLTGYKVPKHVEFRAALSKSNVGKILRRDLREES